jgi:hypothetical protein
LVFKSNTQQTKILAERLKDEGGVFCYHFLGSPLYGFNRTFKGLAEMRNDFEACENPSPLPVLEFLNNLWGLGIE